MTPKRNGANGRHQGYRNFFNNKLDEKGLSDLGWGILPFHKLYIPRIAELTWEFCHPTAGYANKIDIL
jgi:hypothetical protein